MTPTPTPPVLEPLAGSLLLPPTVLELRQAKLTVGATGTRRKAALGVTIAVGRDLDPAGVAFKIALRDRTCRWWSFSSSRFLGSTGRKAVRGRKRAPAKACTTPPNWKLATSTWTGGTATLTSSLGGPLGKGRYAVRVRVQRGTTVLAERVIALRVR